MLVVLVDVVVGDDVLEELDVEELELLDEVLVEVDVLVVLVVGLPRAAAGAAANRANAIPTKPARMKVHAVPACFPLGCRIY